MPHLTAHVLESQLTGNESGLIEALTNAVVDVYGDWVRDGVSVRLDAVPISQWGVGGVANGTAAPSIAFGIRATVLERPDAGGIVSALCVKITDAVADVLVGCDKESIVVEFVPTPPALTSVGGVVGA
jgi:phenylpyruvate tautomerase PptA (4-oxalocrotonate tautomerase family)